MEYCDCRIPSPSSHHEDCINEGCGKKIKSMSQELSEVLKENRELKKRIKKAIKMTHNIRTYSICYTPIKEGCQEVLRVLKGRE